MLAGCPQYADPTAPREIHRVEEPRTRSDYYVYVPTAGDDGKPLPLVVLCHGTTPWDSPKRQIRDWVKLAEEKAFIVAAPRLRGTRGDFPPAAPKQMALQREDEATILAVVRHVRAANNIAPQRIFLTGWSAGGYAVLYTGLRNPDLFRALAVLQGNFRADYLSGVADAIDPYQPVYVLHGTTDILTGGQGQACIDWLYKHNAYVIDGTVPGPHRSHPEAANEFFEKVIREIPWMRLRAFGVHPQQPLMVNFKARMSFEPEFYAWSFGDGQSSPVASPTHTYAQPGAYTVTLVATTARGKEVKRSIQVRVPQANLTHHLNE